MKKDFGYGSAEKVASIPSFLVETALTKTKPMYDPKDEIMENEPETDPEGNVEEQAELMEND